MGEYGNLLEGRSTPSRGAGRFQVREGLHPERVVASFPVSDERDMEHALAALGRGSSPWRERSVESRLACLAAAGGRLEGDVEAAGEVAGALGLRPDEALGLQEGLVASVRAVAARFEERGNGAPGEPGGTAVVVLDWRQLWRGAWESITGQLLRGRAALLLPDAHVPTFAARIAQALLEAGLPETELALLHGATDPALHLAVETAGVRALVATGSTRRVARLRRHAEAGGVAEQALRVPRSRAFEVDDGADPAAAAREVVRGAFGRVTALSGQLAGQIGRVFCPDRLHSAFTSALMEELERDPDVADPLPLIDRDAADFVRRAWSLGLDEGATMIFGGTATDEGPDETGERRRGVRQLVPTVFTNVEPFMETARRPEPAPVLALIRS